MAVKGAGPGPGKTIQPNFAFATAMARCYNDSNSHCKERLLVSELEPTTETPPAPVVEEAAPASAAASLGRGAWEIVQILVLALLMVMVIRNFIHNYRIDGISMEPNFHDQQFLIVNRFAYCPGIHVEIPVVNISLFDKTWCARVPNRGDVVIFRYPRDPLATSSSESSGCRARRSRLLQARFTLTGSSCPSRSARTRGATTRLPLP